ncbi:hypothetical protein SISSUDRAFT_1051292 [Sistotremastrum suecicum HHB10207 ss-3]|uniref:Uncharacterized protein n=1 Tax=Sistotremastrum suecicum HHB10207 ss-3 TaxID=1314776 RepID=A0A166AN44_9AGAM|nr:hypothetical protein SISSUDRAFT_1051292 [Sistotremastrum suecicum HHB10207 ss-3]
MDSSLLSHLRSKKRTKTSTATSAQGPLPPKPSASSNDPHQSSPSASPPRELKRPKHSNAAAQQRPSAEQAIPSPSRPQSTATPIHGEATPDGLALEQHREPPRFNPHYHTLGPSTPSAAATPASPDSIATTTTVRAHAVSEKLCRDKKKGANHRAVDHVKKLRDDHDSLLNGFDFEKYFSKTKSSTQGKLHTTEAHDCLSDLVKYMLEGWRATVEELSTLKKRIQSGPIGDRATVNHDVSIGSSRSMLQQEIHNASPSNVSVGTTIPLPHTSWQPAGAYSSTAISKDGESNTDPTFAFTPASTGVAVRLPRSMGTGTNEAPAPGIIVQPQYNDNVANHAGPSDLSKYPIRPMHPYMSSVQNPVVQDAGNGVPYYDYFNVYSLSDQNRSDTLTIPDDHAWTQSGGERMSGILEMPQAHGHGTASTSQKYPDTTVHSAISPQVFNTHSTHVNPVQMINSVGHYAIGDPQLTFSAHGTRSSH